MLLPLDIYIRRKRQDHQNENLASFQNLSQIDLNDEKIPNVVIHTSDFDQYTLTTQHLYYNLLPFVILQLRILFKYSSTTNFFIFIIINNSYYYRLTAGNSY